jgi:hypothetical protein
MQVLLKQKGAALIGYVAIAAIGAGLASYYGLEKMKADYEVGVIRESALKMEQIQSAHLQCYNDMRRWCTSAEMTGYYQGNNQVIGGDNITYQVDGRNLIFSVDIGSEGRAKKLSELVVTPTLNGTLVRSSIKPPTDASIFSERLQRYDNAIDSDRTIMATSLGMAGYDIKNANSVTSQDIVSQQIDVDTLNAKTTVVASELNIGGNRIVSVGNDIEIYAQTVKPSGTVTLDKDLFGTSTSEITGITNATGNDSEFNSVITTNLDSTSGVFDNINANKATTNELTATTGIITNANIGDLTFVGGIGSKLNTSSLLVNNDLNGQQLTALDSTIGTLSSTQANINNAILVTLISDNITTNSLNTVSAQFTDLQANTTTSDVASTGILTSSTANIGSLITSALSGNVGVAKSTTSDNLTTISASITGNLNGSTLIAKNGTVKTLNATNLDATASNNVVLTNIIANNINVDNLVGVNATIVDVIVNNTLISDKLIANVANISLLKTSQASITHGNFYKVNAVNGTVNDATMNSFNAVDAEFDNLSASSISANNANIKNFDVDTLTVSNTLTSNTMNADNYSGNQFNASGDFYTRTASVNGNANNLKSLYNSMDNCINTTKYCLPQDPTVNLVCSGCNQVYTGSGFSATAQASIGNCRQGCTYSWSTSGSGMTFAGCTSGSVPVGGSATPQCRATQTLGPEQTSSGSISITVTNKHYTSKSASDIELISWENITPRAVGCDAVSIAYDIALSTPQTSFTYNYPALAHGQNFSDSSGKSGNSSSTHCKIFGQNKYHWLVHAFCDNGVLTDTAFAECNS